MMSRPPPPLPPTHPPSPAPQLIHSDPALELETKPGKNTKRNRNDISTTRVLESLTSSSSSYDETDEQGINRNLNVTKEVNVPNDSQSYLKNGATKEESVNDNKSGKPKSSEELEESENERIGEGNSLTTTSDAVDSDTPQEQPLPSLPTVSISAFEDDGNVRNASHGRKRPVERDARTMFKYRTEVFRRRVPPRPFHHDTSSCGTGHQEEMKEKSPKKTAKKKAPSIGTKTKNGHSKETKTKPEPPFAETVSQQPTSTVPAPPQEPTGEAKPEHNETIKTGGKTPVYICDRECWYSRKTLYGDVDSDECFLNLPALGVVFITNTEVDACTTNGDCVNAIGKLQSHHMDNMGLKDIAYNWLVGGDLTVYEGLGWDRRSPAARNKSLNIFIGHHIYIGFLGRYHPEDLPDKMLSQAMAFIYLSMPEGRIKEDYLTQVYEHLLIIDDDKFQILPYL